MVSRRRLPSLASIGAFEAAARHGGFAAAARELGTSAASVSWHVRQLEQQIDVSLFRRAAQRVELTTAGRALAEQAIDAFAALRASFGRAAESEGARLSISVLPTFGTSWLAPRLGDFGSAHPDLELEVDLSPDVRDLQDGAIDAAVRNGDGRWPGLAATFLFPSVFTPLCAPTLLAAAEDLGRPERPLSVPLLGRPDWWALWFRALGCERVASISVRLSEEHLDVAAAIAGHGVTVGSPLLFRREIEAGRLAPAHPLVVATGRAFWFVRPVGRRRLDKIDRFAGWIEAEAAAERDASRSYLDRAVRVDERSSAP